MTTRVLAFAGSVRRDSWNVRLIKIAAEQARAAGAELTLLDLAKYPLPIFDEDSESSQGLHPNALALKDLFKAHHALLIACPEYNSSITPLLKNTIDWISRPRQGERPLECFSGKVCALLAASPGALGGLRGLVHVRAILGNIGVIVLPDQLALPKAHEAFKPEGTLADPAQTERIAALAKSLVRAATRLMS